MVQCLVTECVAGSAAPEADGYGGGITVQKGDVSLVQTRITHCHAFALESQATGGGLAIADGTVTIANCSIVECTVTAINGNAWGGGLLVDGGSVYVIATRVIGCTALLNITQSAGTNLLNANGGGVFQGGGTSTFGDCLFTSCTALVHDSTTTSASSGLVQSIGGGLQLFRGATNLMSVTVRACQAWTGGGLSISSPAGSAISMSGVLLADNRATKSGAAIYFEQLGSSLRFNSFLMQIEPHCPVAEEQNVPILAAVGAANDPVLSLRALSVRRGPCASPAPLVYGFTLPTCNATFPSLTLPRQRVDYCGHDATCVAHDPEYPEYLTPACECAPPAYPSPLAAYPLHAPYTEGCVLPIEAANLTHVAPSVLTTLEKTVSIVPHEHQSISLRLTGTTWSLPSRFGGVSAYPFTVATVGQISWLHVLTPSGFLRRPAIDGEDSVATVMVNVSAAGLAESPQPYEAAVRVAIDLTDRLRSSVAPVRRIEYRDIPVKILVRAQPVAGECFVDANEPSPLQAVLDEPASFTFSTRDVEGLPLDHSVSDDLSATLYRCNASAGCDMAVSNPPITYRGGGNYTAHVTLLALGDFAVGIQLRQTEGANPVSLGFQKAVVANCPRGYYSALVIGGGCRRCPEGVRCALPPRSSAAQINHSDPMRAPSKGAELQTLWLLPNKWRLSALTTDLRNCTPPPAVTTPCRGGPNASEYCIAGHEGPYCRVCSHPDHYFDSSSSQCLRCRWRGAAAFFVAVGVVLGFLSLAVALATAIYCLSFRRNRLGKALRAAGAHLTRFGLSEKAKLLLGFYQVAVSLPVVFDVPLPREYYAATRVFDIINLDWLSSLSSLHASCVGPFELRLALKALLPLALLALYLVAYLASSARVQLAGLLLRVPASQLQADQLPTSQRHAGDAMLAALPVVLVFLFCVVPSVSRDVFAAFVCDGFGYSDATSTMTAIQDLSEHYYLHADYSVRCSHASYRSHRYDRIRTLAYIFIAVWPLGVPCLFGGLLTVHHRRRSPILSRAIGFLYREYAPDFFWFELLELARKLVLVGFLLLVPQRLSLVRILAGLLLMIAYLVVLLGASPYRAPSTAAVAIGTNVTLTCTLLASLVLKISAALTPHQRIDLIGSTSDFWLTLLIIAFNFGVLGCTLLLLGYQLAIERFQRRFAVARRLRWCDTGEEVVLTPPLEPGAWHLFLSHAWRGATTGQDQMRVVKTQLVDMLPDARVFLEHVQGSRTRPALPRATTPRAS